MENKMTDKPEQFPKIDNIGKTTIGLNRYLFLKSLSYEDLSDFEKEQIEVYEQRVSSTPEQEAYVLNYIKKITSPEPKIIYDFTSEQLYRTFLDFFFLINKKEFEVNDETVENLKPLLHYFSKDKRFFECQNISSVSEPSFDKSLLIMGDFGNGKTAVMKTFEAIFKQMPGLSFKGYSSKDVVMMYEKCTGDNQEILRKEFEQTMYRGNRYFDDVKSERTASLYGKLEIFRDIIETRYDSREQFKTHISCNYKSENSGNVEKGLDEFGEKYGDRVYDRLFEMYNVIEFHGKSFRR